MPDNMLIKLCASKYLFSASEMQLQLFYSVLDQYYHMQPPEPLSTTDLLAKLQVEYYGLPYVENTVRYICHIINCMAKMFFKIKFHANSRHGSYGFHILLVMAQNTIRIWCLRHWRHALGTNF